MFDNMFDFLTVWQMLNPNSPLKNSADDFGLFLKAKMKKMIEKCF